MPPNGKVDLVGKPKKRGRPSKADKLAIELARRVAGAVSAAAVAAKASAAKAREQLIKRKRGRPPKTKKDVKAAEPSVEEEESEEAPEVNRPKSRRKGAPKRAPGSTADWFLKPLPVPPIKRQPRDLKHLDITATNIGKRETKRNPKFDEFVTFGPRKLESSADETSRNPLSSGGASEAETESNAGPRKRGELAPQDEGYDLDRWGDVTAVIETTFDAGLFSKDEAEQLKVLAKNCDKLLQEAIFEVESDPSLGNFAQVVKDRLSRRIKSGSR